MFRVSSAFPSTVVPGEGNAVGGAPFATRVTGNRLGGDPPGCTQSGALIQRRSAALSGEPFRLLPIAFDFLGQLGNGIGIELFCLLDQLPAFLVALDETV